MEKLLLIDDEADVQYSFRRIFDQPEIQLTTADSGEEGLKLIPRLKPQEARGVPHNRILRKGKGKDFTHSLVHF